MIIDKPDRTEPLRLLWKQAFGDTDAFLDCFFSSGFSPNRCRQIKKDGKVVAALYWFDCTFHQQKIAYLYAVATDRDYQNQGLCRKLMEDTHRHLQSAGYRGAFLVPGSESLFRFYEKLGYRICSSVTEFTCTPSGTASPKKITPEEYLKLRNNYLPAGSVVPGENMLCFMAEQYFFYAGDDFVLCGSDQEDRLIVTELLGNVSAAPGIVAFMGKQQGQFRTPGNGKPFAMYYPFTCDLDAPAYFALALD